MAYVTFAGLANGAPWPPYWAAGGYLDHTIDVQGEQGRLRCASIGQAFARRTTAMSGGMPLNVDLTTRFRFVAPVSSSATLYLALRCDAPVYGGPQNGYFWDLRRPGTSTTQLRRRAATEEVLADGPTLDVTDGSMYLAHFRVRTVSSSEVEIRCKLWRDGQAEPPWQLTFSDTSAARRTTNPNGFIWYEEPNVSIGEVRFQDTELTNSDLYLTAPTFTATHVDSSDGQRVDLVWGSSAPMQIERQAWTGRGRPK